MCESLVGVHGVSQVGKDSLANYLVQNYGYTRIALADPVREAYYNLNPLISIKEEQWDELNLNFIDAGSDELELFYDRISDVNFIRLQVVVNHIGWDKAKQIPEIRQGLQKIGTDSGRNIHGNKCCTNIAEQKMKGIAKVVVSDVRFPDESTWLREQDYDKRIIFRVQRNGIGSVNEHVSDVGLSSEFYDEDIYNNGTLEELYKQIAYFVEKYNL